MSPDPERPDREEQVARLLQSAAQRERAPEALRTEVASIRSQAAAQRRRRPTFKPALGFVSAGTAAVVAAVVALVVALGGAGAPSLAQAAALASLPPAAPAPARDPSDPRKLLAAKVGTLHFPNWESNGGWRAVGRRFDHIGNRTAMTVYYSHGSSRAVYSIVSSPTLPIKRALVLESLPSQTYPTVSRDGRTTVVWEES